MKDHEGNITFYIILHVLSEKHGTRLASFSCYWHLIQNCEYQDVNQGHLRKSLQISTNAMKNNYLTTAYIFFAGRSIFIYS